MTALASSSYDRCPTAEYINSATMDTVAPMVVIDSRGNRIQFGSIFEFQRTVVVFIHINPEAERAATLSLFTHLSGFILRSIQSYVANLARVSPDALDAAGTKIVLIGCGAWDMIPSYQGTTGFRGLVYSDPTGKLHDALGLQKLASSGSSGSSSSSSSPQKGGEVPSYLLEQSHPVKKGIFESLKRPIDGLRGRNGNTQQLGGDLVLGPGNVCVYAHRMRNTTDHVEIPDLLSLVDVRPHPHSASPTASAPLFHAQQQQQQYQPPRGQQHGRGSSIPLNYAATSNHQAQNANVAYALSHTTVPSPPSSIGDVHVHHNVGQSNGFVSPLDPAATGNKTRQRKRASTTAGAGAGGGTAGGGNFNSRDRHGNTLPSLPLLSIPSNTAATGASSSSGDPITGNREERNRERRRSMRPTTASGSSNNTPSYASPIQPTSSFSSTSSSSSHLSYKNPSGPSRLALGIITRRPSTATTTTSNTTMSMSPTPPLTPTTPDRDRSMSSAASASSSFNYHTNYGSPNYNYNPGNQSPIDRNIISPSLRSSIGLLNHNATSTHSLTSMPTTPTNSSTTSANQQQQQHQQQQPQKTSRKDKRRTITTDNFRMMSEREREGIVGAGAGSGNPGGMSYYGYVRRALDEMEDLAPQPRR
ncbi:hypothetical protein FRB97_004511 [Tulasnella sp. 331]|nr:hypothetical protein FRB97_004511 [Tulasnella sp. 331]